MSLQTDLAAAVASAQMSAATLHAIVHGPATGPTSMVDTDNGPVPTLARAAASGVTGPASWASPVAWATGLVCTATAPATLVTNGGNLYVCKIDHTAGASFATDLAANKWFLIEPGFDATADHSFSGTQDFTGGRAKVPTRSAGDNGTDAASTAFVQAALVAGLRSHLGGLAFSTAGGSTTFSMAAGIAMDGGNTALMILAAAISKTTGAWAVGSGNGSLDTGTIANNTWYHAWLIQRPDTGVVDVLTSLSATAPTMPANYTLKRRVFPLRTDGSGKWLLLRQFGDLFIHDAPFAESQTTLASSANNVVALAGVPSGIAVRAIFNMRYYGGSWGSAYVYSGQQTALTGFPNGGTSTNFTELIGSSGNGGSARFDIMTDTSQHVQIYCGVAGSPSSPWAFSTEGFIDTRGKEL